MRQWATLVPVSESMLEDSRPPMLNAWLRRGLMRRFTVEQFNEDWSSAEAEQERLDFGAVMPWDSAIYEDEDDDW